ncbi:AAA family ATPase [Frigidibacter albus]|uniref:AAA family ATPase n=1 Tax=Frigidibacter albus TaxID=1465486 RepID=A0A6L8VGH4_9RHOB|nr:AAA family ATPase [Frigidibacter albus]MZQ89353.1 AAA family ATPase [Frigidibacter albus]NBE31259.1 AAA family ATPase [Frigidibacter albus]GGH53755.1 pilus assembly protein CpaE [Frigidibacter albus]
MGNAAPALQPEPAPIVACTVSRDVANFDLLIEDMEAELGESWGDLAFPDALKFLDQPEAKHLEFIAVAVDGEDEADLTRVSGIIGRARDMGIRVILIADEISPIALHHLLRMGADDFVPYPLPENALHEAIERLKEPEVAAPVHADPHAHPLTSHAAPAFKATGQRDGVVLPVHGLAGGTGASTFAVNLAWELATLVKDNGPRVCLLDFDFQMGSVATYLDLPRREAVYDMLSDTSVLDGDTLLQSMLTYHDRLQVLTAPAEMLPLDIVTSEDINRLIDVARDNFDFVVIDMPSAVVQWTEAVLNQAHVYFVPIELDMRSAQNTLRMIRALKSEELPVEKLRYVLNRAPKFTDLAAKGRVKRLAESLDITIELQFPDGGRQVTQANDHGLPLATAAAKNPLRKEIQKLAKSLFDLNRAAEAGKV